MTATVTITRDHPLADLVDEIFEIPASNSNFGLVFSDLHDWAQMDSPEAGEDGDTWVSSFVLHATTATPEQIDALTRVAASMGVRVTVVVG